MRSEKVTVKAISLWEPWATAMRLGLKRIETRSWETLYRGPLLICAAKRWSSDQQDYLDEAAVQAALKDALGYPMDRVRRSDLYCGQAVCLVDLVATKRTVDMTLSDTELLFGDYGPRRFGWVTANLRTFTPFPVIGRQSLFGINVPEPLA